MASSACTHQQHFLFSPPSMPPISLAICSRVVSLQADLGFGKQSAGQLMFTSVSSNMEDSSYKAITVLAEEHRCIECANYEKVSLNERMWEYQRQVDKGCGNTKGKFIEKLGTQLILLQRMS